MAVVLALMAMLIQKLWLRRKVEAENGNEKNENFEVKLLQNN